MQCLCHCSSYLRKTTNTPTLYGGEGEGLCILLSSEMTLFESQQFCRRLLTQFPVVSWCCARIRSPNEVFQKGFKRHWIIPTQGSHSLQKSLNFRRCPWKVLEFFSALNVVAWKEFFMLFGCPRWNINHSSENSKVIHKVLHVLCNN